MYADPSLIVTSGVIIATIAACAAISGCIAYIKRRSPLEGVLLGLFLGPIGVLIESRHPYVQRPSVDPNAWNSLQSMMTYQQNSQEGLPRSTRSKRSKRSKRL